MWLNATSDRDSILHPIKLPFVDRAVMAPLTSDSATFTSVEAVDTYISKNPINEQSMEWGEV